MIDTQSEQQDSLADSAYWQREGMQDNPFVDNGDAESYFPGAGRAELLQEALRITRFATQITVFAGAQGIGKTKLVEALTAGLAGVQCVLRLQGDFMLSCEQVYGQIGNAVGMQAKSQAPDDLRTQILFYLEQGLTHSRSVILLVDDAHELPEESLAQLLALAQDHGNDIKLLLFAATDANGELRPELSSAAMQRIDIVPFDLNGVEGYLRHRLKNAGYTDSFPFTDADLLSLLEHSGGIPEHLHDMGEQKLRDFLSLRPHAAPQALARWATPWLHIALSVGLLLFISVLWIGGGGDDAIVDPSERLAEPAPGVDSIRALPEPETPAATEQPLPVTAERNQTKERDSQETAAARAPVPTAGVAATEPIAQSKPPASDTDSRKPATKIAAPAAEKIVVAKPSTAPSSSRPVEVVEKSAALRSRAYTSDESYLLSLPASHYTLQLVGSKSLQGVQDFARKHKANEIRVFRQRLNDKPWFVAVTGSYPNQEQAITALTRLPGALRQLKPWARPLSRVQGDIKSAR